MKRKRVKDLLSNHVTGEQVLVKGWVRTKREIKNVAFVALNDGSTINNIQVVVDISLFPAELLRDITTGASLGVTGTIEESQGKGQSIEILASDIVLFG
jgi:asparaginyl-tRNA synthetase